MGALLLACRVLLAGVFVSAGLAKLADLRGSRQAVFEFGVPERLAGLVGVLVPMAEVGVGVALVPLSSARYGALAAALLLACFIGAIANALAHGRAPDCHCFGQVHSAPAGVSTVARNLLLLVVAGFVAIGGWQHPGVSATHWVAQVGAAWLVAIAAGVVIVALVCFQVWFMFQLLAQNGRTLRRLDELEGSLRAIGDVLGLQPNDPVGDPGPLGYGLNGDGLPVGSSAPGFELEAVDGGRYSLGSLLDPTRRLVLVFSAPGCGPCDALMPQLARWERDHQDSLQIALIVSGNADQNRAKAMEHGLRHVLLQAEREVADAYRAHATPMALVIDSDGRIASPTVGGSEAITTLLVQATRPKLAIQGAPVENPRPNGAPPRQAQPPHDSLIGQPAPELVLTDLDGSEVALQDFYGESTVAIFWNPGCGFCQQMLPDLKAFEDDPPEDAPRLMVISAGDVDLVREQDIGSMVLVDADGEAMRAFGAGGTPMGVLIEHGRIRSPVAAGADAVLELARPNGTTTHR